MTDSPSGAQQALQALGSRLREIRSEAGLSGRGLGALAGWHSSKVSKIEHGRQTPTVDDIRVWCAKCDAEHLTVELVASLKNMEDLYLGWGRLEKAGFRPLAENLNQVWERTSHIRVYGTNRVPGPIQSAGYVRAILQGLRQRREVVDDVEAAVALRMERQQLVYRSDRRFAFLLEEQALRTRFGTDVMLAEQLAHLVILAGLPAVSLGIIPTSVHRPFIWPSENFWMFDDDAVMLDLATGLLTMRTPQEIATYARVFADLSSIAVYGVAARRLITSAIEALDG